MREINAAGLNLIQNFEGCKLTAYKDQRGILTIGFGHTGPDVTKGLTITQEQANNLLQQDVSKTAKLVDSMIYNNINENQFSACVSLAYNIGTGAFGRSTLLIYINNNQLAMAAMEFLKWDHTLGELNFGLLNRRKAEQTLFNTPQALA